jgi:hypothetical protein
VVTNQNICTAIIYDLQSERQKRSLSGQTSESMTPGHERSETFLTFYLQLWLDSIRLGMRQCEALGIPVPANFLIACGIISSVSELKFQH